MFQNLELPQGQGTRALLLPRQLRYMSTNDKRRIYIEDQDAHNMGAGTERVN